VVSSVGHVHGNIVVSVVPAGETVFRISGLPSVRYMNVAGVAALLFYMVAYNKFGLHRNH
jgi:hypothetical protein